MNIKNVKYFNVRNQSIILFMYINFPTTTEKRRVSKITWALD